MCFVCFVRLWINTCVCADDVQLTKASPGLLMDHVLYLDDRIVGFSHAVAGSRHFSLKLWNVHRLHIDLQAHRSGLPPSPTCSSSST